MGEITAFLVTDSKDSIEIEKIGGAEERKEYYWLNALEWTRSAIAWW